MKIAICDDNLEDLMKIEKLLNQYASLYPNIDFTAEKFSDPIKLYNRILKNELADIYLLDMIMSEKNGVDIGRQLRKSGSENVIIYITSSQDFALDAYHLHAVR